MSFFKSRSYFNQPEVCVENAAIALQIDPDGWISLRAV
jgi:hypothetical protein